MIHSDVMVTLDLVPAGIKPKSATWKGNTPYAKREVMYDCAIRAIINDFDDIPLVFIYTQDSNEDMSSEMAYFYTLLDNELMVEQSSIK